jgi:hypothetical protein
VSDGRSRHPARPESATWSRATATREGWVTPGAAAGHDGCGLETAQVHRITEHEGSSGAQPGPLIARFTENHAGGETRRHATGNRGKQRPKGGTDAQLELVTTGDDPTGRKRRAARDGFGENTGVDDREMDGDTQKGPQMRNWNW